VPAGLLLLDLDRFKEVNDTLGHHYGDLLLVQVSQRLRGGLREVDTVARLGGDEFAILLPQVATAEGAVEVAKKLTAGFDEPFQIEGLTLDVEASIGIALYPEHAGTGEELLQHADIAMYTAKDTHAGYMLFDRTQDQHSPRRLALLGELRRALERDQLVLHYQPKVDVDSGEPMGVEALVRWQHPEHGLLSPAEFIPLAERTGLIHPLTHYVLNAALRQCQQWHHAGHEVSVAVNVSARRLLDVAFPDEVVSLLARWDVPAARLVVEITESTILAATSACASSRKGSKTKPPGRHSARWAATPSRATTPASLCQWTSSPGGLAKHATSHRQPRPAKRHPPNEPRDWTGCRSNRVRCARQIHPTVDRPTVESYRREEPTMKPSAAAVVGVVGVVALAAVLAACGGGNARQAAPAAPAAPATPTTGSAVIRPAPVPAPVGKPLLTLTGAVTNRNDASAVVFDRPRKT